MAFEEDFTTFFDEEGFGVPCSFGAVAFTGIFDNAYFETQGDELGVAGSQPRVQFETAKLNPAPRYGDEITVNGTDYTVVGIEPDGTGCTLLILEKQA